MIVIAHHCCVKVIWACLTRALRANRCTPPTGFSAYQEAIASLATPSRNLPSESLPFFPPLYQPSSPLECSCIAGPKPQTRGGGLKTDGAPFLFLFFHPSILPHKENQVRRMLVLRGWKGETGQKPSFWTVCLVFFGFWLMDEWCDCGSLFQTCMYSEVLISTA